MRLLRLFTPRKDIVEGVIAKAKLVAISEGRENATGHAQRSTNTVV